MGGYSMLGSFYETVHMGKKMVNYFHAKKSSLSTFEVRAHGKKWVVYIHAGNIPLTSEIHVSFLPC